MPFRRAFIWAIVMIWGQRGVATLMTFALAALLGPDAFGLVALAMIYIALVQIFLEQGLTSAIIQRNDLQPEHLDSAFWINIALSTILAAATVITSEWMAGINDMPELAAVLRALALLLLIKGLTVVQEAVLRRSLDFRTLAIRGNAGTAVGGLVGVGLALAGVGVWALVAQQLVAAVLMLILLWSIADWRPRLRFSWNHSRELLSFSLKVLFARVGTFLEGRIDALIIGPFFGPAAIGLLRLAERAIDTVTHIAAHPAALLSLPHLSRQQDDQEVARREISRCIEAATILTFPAMVVLAVVADDLMRVLGEEWLAAAAPLRIFCIAGAARALTIVVGQALQAAGRPLYYAFLMWAITLISGVAFAVIAWKLRHEGVAAQIMGIAIWKAIITVAVVVPVSLAMIQIVTGFSFFRGLAATGPAMGASFVVGGVGLVALWVLEETAWPAWLRLVILSATMGAAFVAAIAFFKPTLRRQILDRLRKPAATDLDGPTSESLAS